MPATIEASIDGGPAIDLNDPLSPVTLAGLAADTTYNSLRLRRVSDAGIESAWSEAVGPVTTDALPPTLLFQVSCGFPGILGAAPFEDDNLNSYHGGTGAAAGSYGSPPNLAGVPDPAPSIVYHGLRYNTAGNTFTYTFPVTALKEYRIRLHYGVMNAAPFNNASCPMTITINGVAQPTLDPYIDSGSPGSAIGWIKEYTLTQGAGTSLTILFAGVGAVQPFVMAIEIIEIPPMTVSTMFLTDGGDGVAYSETLETDDEVGSVTWAISSGSLPTGLTLNASTGEISGTPTIIGAVSFMVQATDSKSPTPQIATKLLSILIDEPITSFLLDGVSATALRAYSTRKLYSAYSGPCWRVKRASDSTELDIDFNAVGKLDKTQLLNFVADTTYLVLKWYDQSPTGDDLVSVGTQEPTGAPSHFLSSRSGVDFGTAGAKQMISVANISATNPKVYLAAHVKQVWTRDYEFLFAIAATIRGSVNKGQLSMYGTHFTNNGRFDGGQHQLTYWFTAGDDKVVIDGVDYPCQVTANTAADSGNSLSSGDKFYLGSYHAFVPGDGLSGVVGECIVFDGTVSSGNDATIQASQDEFFIVAPAAADPISFHHNIIMEGDSLFMGYQNSPASLPHIVLQAALGSDRRVRNVAYSGQNLLTEITDEADVQIDPYWDAAYTSNVLVVLAGINDFHDNPATDAADLQTGLTAYVAARKAAYPALQVIVCTITACDPANGYITVGQQTERTNFNTWLRANWSTTVDADGLCDLDAIPEMADPTDDTYYHDIGGGDFGLHWTDLAVEDFIVPEIQAAIIALP